MSLGIDDVIGVQRIKMLRVFKLHEKREEDV